MADFFPFLQNAFKYFARTGALLPSSPFLAKAIARRIDNRTKLNILEVGAGTGAVTREIIKKMHAESHLVLCEINQDFVDHLKKLLENDSAFKTHQEQIEIFPHPVQKLQAEHTYDLIISSLPFRNFDPKSVKEILAHFDKLLKPNGVLIFFEYKWIWGFKVFLNQKKAQRMGLVDQILQEYLSNLHVEKENVFLNFPPALIYICQKSRRGMGANNPIPVSDTTAVSKPRDIRDERDQRDSICSLLNART